MISFFSNTDVCHDPFPRHTANRTQDPRQSCSRPDQRPDGSKVNAPVDCPRLCPPLDYPAILHFSNNLSTVHDSSASQVGGDIADVPTQAMLPDSWGTLPHLTANFGRTAHQRESSLSSLGSTGPASPYTGHTSASNPQIALSDSALDGSADVHVQEMSPTQGGGYYQYVKSNNGFTGCSNFDPSLPEKMGYPMAISGPCKKSKFDRTLLPAPDLAGDSGRSRPISAASSTTGDSPTTPNPAEPDQPERRRTDFCNVPKLDRTMTDVYGDELYSPNFAITSTSPPHVAAVTSPSNDIFTQRIHAANNQHLHGVQAPIAIGRARSPFRTGSPFASTAIPRQGFAVFNTAHRTKDCVRPPPDVEPFRETSVNSASTKIEPETPKTISPKDALLEFNDGETSSNFPLFPQDASAMMTNQLPKETLETQPDISYLDSTEPNDVANVGALNFMSAQLPAALALHQQYPFTADAQALQLSPPQLNSSMPSNVESNSGTPTKSNRPSGTGADGGTYTCTYHGCTLRFETPLLLQKHKREGHRQTQGLGAPREIRAASPTGLLNTQAGPHRCDRINPSTGKPCNTVFSRPYDLTRHEDTIHNARKQKVRCDLCTEEKTFSRADALTRHYRVCHPEMELPGKHKRRAV